MLLQGNRVARVKKCTRTSLLVALGVVASFAGASFAPSGPMPKAGASVDIVTVCAVEGRIASFQILRGPVRNPTSFSFPKLVIVKDLTSARSVARALCALPRPNPGVYNCPAGVGPNYALTFLAPGYEVRKVDIELAECGTVIGMTTERTISHSPGFWKILGHSMKINDPSGETFTGTTKS